MNHPLAVPAAVAALLAAGLALGHRWLQRQRAERLARQQALSLQTWEGEGGALPPAPPARRVRRERSNP